MSIINCTECHEKVSTLATSCPHCGAPCSSKIAPETETVAVSSATSKSLCSATPIPAIHQVADIDRDAIARMANQRMWDQLTAFICVGIGIAIIVYPTDKTFTGILNAVFVPPPGYGRGWVGIAMYHWKSCLLFLIGKIAWEHGK